MASASADQTGIVWGTTAEAQVSALEGPADEMAQDEKELQPEVDTVAQARREARLPAPVSQSLQSSCCVIS